MTPIDGLFLLICSLMVFFMQAGFLCLEVGASRVTSVGHIALKNMSEIAVVGLLFWMVGFGVMFGNSFHGLFGTSLFFVDFEGTDLPQGAANLMLFQLAFAATAISIISGAVAERCRFTAYLAISVLVSLLIYPVIGHAVWGNLINSEQSGWLQAIGFVDFAGATVVHSTGGWAALAAALYLGARRGRFGRRRLGRFSSSSVAMSTLGAMLLWIGWLGFNAGSAMVFDKETPVVLVKTVLAASGGLTCAIFVSLLNKGIVTAPIMLTGMLAGLVAATAGIQAYSTIDAVVVGCAGSIVAYWTNVALKSLKIDDPVQAVSIHLTPGIWGTLAVAFYASPEHLAAGGVFPQILAQLVGIAFCAVWAFGGTLLILTILNRIMQLRVSPRAEVTGIDHSEHGITPPMQALRVYQNNNRRIKSRFAAIKRELETPAAS